MTRRTHSRRGATLVELMVAAAMSIMIMWLLTWCYQQGLASFSNTKAHADLMDQERMVSSVMSRDLKADHFLDEDGKPNRGRRVSDQWLDRLSVTYSKGKNPMPTGLTGYTPPRAGYFLAGSPAPDAAASPVTAFVNVFEPTPTDGFTSSRSTTHFLQFTVVLPGGPPEQLFTAEVPFGTGKSYVGRAAEIAYFLDRSGQTPGGYPLYHLIRRQRLCAMTKDDALAYNTRLAADVRNAADAGEASEVMATTGTLPATVFSLADLTNPAKRMGRTPIGSVNRLGEDILMSNVTSVEIKFTGAPYTTKPPITTVGVDTQASCINWPAPFPGNSDYPYDNLPFDGQFDTFGTIPGWNSTSQLATTGSRPTNNTNPLGLTSQSGPLKTIRITGVLIRIRAYEPRTRTTRQTTFTVDL